jgi:hypothetical protein
MNSSKNNPMNSAEIGSKRLRSGRKLVEIEGEKDGD